MLTVLQGNLHTHQDMGTVHNLVKELKTADNKGSKDDWGTVGKGPWLDSSLLCNMVAFRWLPLPFLGTTALSHFARAGFFRNLMRSGPSLHSQSALPSSLKFLPKLVFQSDFSLSPWLDYKSSRMFASSLCSGLNTAWHVAHTQKMSDGCTNKQRRERVCFMWEQMWHGHRTWIT